MKRKRCCSDLIPLTKVSIIQMAAGWVFISHGMSYVFLPIGMPRAIALSAALDFLPIKAWGYIFIGIGVFVLMASRVSRKMKVAGFVTLTGMSAVWASVYAAGIIFYDSSWLNVINVMLWTGFAVIWWAASGLMTRRDTP